MIAFGRRCSTWADLISSQHHFERKSLCSQSVLPGSTGKLNKSAYHASTRAVSGLSTDPGRAVVRKKRSVATQPPSRAHIHDVGRRVPIFSQPGTRQADHVGARWTGPGPTWAVVSPKMLLELRPTFPNR